MSILEGRPELKAVIDQVAEVTGYLWQKGWAERNGGNITVNVTEYMDDECKKLPPISDVKPIGMTLSQLKGKYFYCKGTGKRMRDLAREPMQNGSIIRILDDCASYVVIADVNVVPTSELPTHLALQNYLIGVIKIVVARVLGEAVFDNNILLKVVIAVAVMAILYPLAIFIDRYLPWLLGKPFTRRN